MAYREQEHKAGECVACGVLTNESCIACHSLYCKKHKPADEPLCRGCHHAYLPVIRKHRKELRSIRSWRYLGLAVVAVSIPSMIYALMIGNFWAASSFAMFSSVFYVQRRVARRRHRRALTKFFEDCATKGLLRHGAKLLPYSESETKEP